MKYKKLFYRDVMPASLIIFQSTSVSYFIAIFLTMSPIVNFSRTLTPLFPDMFMLSEFLIRLQNQTSSPNSKARSGGHFIVKTTLSFSTLTIIESIMRCDSDSGKKLIKSMVLRTADRQGMC